MGLVAQASQEKKLGGILGENDRVLAVEHEHSFRTADAGRGAVHRIVAIELAALCGAGMPIRPEVDTAAAHLDARKDGLVERAGGIADAVAGAIPVIYGSGLTSPVAYRWKTQVNENAKMPAFSHAGSMSKGTWSFAVEWRRMISTSPSRQGAGTVSSGRTIASTPFGVSARAKRA